MTCPADLRDVAQRYLDAHVRRCRCGGSLFAIGVVNPPTRVRTNLGRHEGAVDVLCASRSSQMGAHFPDPHHDEVEIGWYGLD